ncbi:hypothetical protein SAMN05444397_102601 [Flavobacterium aquidurense]|uniref:FG-GAP repeat-containing protein n=1 Tax=Flavobacterium frigidimaris TaxID=262320 RepID=A0ABX4BNG9_FLAFR|nr:hypothetical protein [Flavobacterium frigidimaris]OXA77524.1 hypothetical protein B0A65_15825 [Flavobacterium frigidimaris]SDY91116.1 hypothetical protein SAMN05444397_102601 [Flavobacterium aquidurense]
MNKIIYSTIVSFFVFSCNTKINNEITASPTTKRIDTSKSQIKSIQKEKTNRILIGTKIDGDFDGDGKDEFAIINQTKQGEGNPVENGTPDEYTIFFSNKTLKPIIIGCCAAQLINEGDLNQDGKEDFSVYQAPMNGTVYEMKTYSLQNSNWKQIIETFLIPTAHKELNNEELQKRVFLENNTMYILKEDPNDENYKLIKKKIKLN